MPHMLCRPFDGPDPAEMGPEMEGGFDSTESAGPVRFVGNDFNFVRSEGDKTRLARSEAVAQESQFLPVKSHERSRDAVHGHRMRAGENDAARFGVRRHRAVAFACHDAIHHGEIAQRFFSWLAAAVEKEEALVQIKHHAPASVVSVPVARTNDSL